MPKLHKIAVPRISQHPEGDKIFSGVHFTRNFIRPRARTYYARNIPKGVVVASDSLLVRVRELREGHSNLRGICIRTSCQVDRSAICDNSPSVKVLPAIEYSTRTFIGR